MRHAHPYIADARLVAANDFPDRTESAPAQEPTGTGRDENQGVPVEPFERGKVEVVVVDVRDEDDVGAMHGSRIDRALPPEVRDARTQHRVGDEKKTVEPNRGAAVSEPRQSGMRDVGLSSHRRLLQVSGSQGG
jgi:hypothetical protein